MRIVTFVVSILVFNLTNAFAQFAPQVGKPGSTAIYKDSSIIKAWATNCTLNLGWQNIADTTLGKAAVGDSTAAIGVAGTSVVSLGDGGEAILTFEQPIANGQGYDFAIFENGFLTDSLAFLELAYVEVSSDGIHYVRFPSSCNVDSSFQVGLEGMNAAKLNNLAGKYIGMYGTPFDLEIFAPLSSVNANRITHVKIIDVVGSILPKYARRDAANHIINDPWPTPFPSSGFDLDAVAVLNQNTEAFIKETEPGLQISMFPNPANSKQWLQMQSNAAIKQIQCIDFLGNVITLPFTLQTPTYYSIHLPEVSGIFVLWVQTEKGTICKKVRIE